MTLEYTDIIAVLIVIVVFGVALWLDLTGGVCLPKVPMKTYPPLPELVCACGDCWELSRDKETYVVCGCGNEYIVSPTNCDITLGGDI